MPLRKALGRAPKRIYQDKSLREQAETVGEDKVSEVRAKFTVGNGTPALLTSSS